MSASVPLLPGIPGLLYIVRKSLYVSLTNNSNTTTLFDSRGTDFKMSDKTAFQPLPQNWHECGSPTTSQVATTVTEAWKRGAYDSVVFAGLGEPTLYPDILLESARALSSSIPDLKLRLNTNGLGSETAGRDLSEELKNSGFGYVTVALNTADPNQHFKLMASPYGIRGLEVASSFARRCAHVGMEVECTAVERPDVDIAAVRAFVESLGGVGFRSRSFHATAKV